MEEWGTSAIVEIETVAAVVKAYADGKIELNGVPKDAGKVSIRYAPSFSQGRSPRGTQRPYVAQSVANFLGWTLKALQQWTPEQCAFDYVKHRIDEGLLMEDHIKTWNCISIKPT